MQPECIVVPSWPTSRPSADSTVVTRLNCYIARTITALLPDATFAPDQDLRPLRPLVVYAEGPADRIKYSASALVVDATGRGSIEFLIFPQEQAPPCAAEIVSGGPGHSPRGEVICVDDLVPPTDQPDSGIRWNRVYLYTGKTVVAVWASNDYPGRGPTATEPTRRTPPLTVDQLVAIATVPELAVYG